MSKHKTIAPVATIELDRTRHLMIDFAAMEFIESVLPTANTLSPLFWSGMNARTAKVVLLAALIHEDPTLTMDGLQEIIKGIGPGTIMDAVLQAVTGSRPEPKDGDEENPPMPETSLPGSDSGASPDTTSS